MPTPAELHNLDLVEQSELEDRRKKSKAGKKSRKNKSHKKKSRKNKSHKKKTHRKKH